MFLNPRLANATGRSVAAQAPLLDSLDSRGAVSIGDHPLKGVAVALRAVPKPDLGEKRRFLLTGLPEKVIQVSLVDRLQRCRHRLVQPKPSRPGVANVIVMAYARMNMTVVASLRDRAMMASVLHST